MIFYSHKIKDEITSDRKRLLSCCTKPNATHTRCEIEYASDEKSFDRKRRKNYVQIKFREIIRPHKIINTYPVNAQHDEVFTK